MLVGLNLTVCFMYRFLRHNQWKMSHDHGLTNEEAVNADENKEYDSDIEYVYGKFFYTLFSAPDKKGNRNNLEIINHISH